MRVIVWVAAPVGMALYYLPRLVGGGFGQAGARRFPGDGQHAVGAGGCDAGGAGGTTGVQEEEEEAVAASEAVPDTSAVSSTAYAQFGWPAKSKPAGGRLVEVAVHSKGWRLLLWGLLRCSGLYGGGRVEGASGQVSPAGHSAVGSGAAGVQAA